MAVANVLGADGCSGSPQCVYGQPCLVVVKTRYVADVSLL